MITPEQATSFKELLDNAQRVMVFFPEKATLDQLAGSTALFLSLKSMGKDVSILSPKKPKNTASLAGLDDLKTELGNENLVVSFKYSPEQVDKVSYHIGEDSGRFYLTIKPKKGHKPLEDKYVEMNYAGAQADLIILVGVHSYESLGMLYKGYEQFFSSTSSIVIHNFQPQIGSFKMDTSGFSSLSEGIVMLASQAQLPLDEQAATNLLLGIEEETKGFQSLTATADTFARVAELMRLGGRRQKRSTKKSVPAVVSPISPGGITPIKIVAPAKLKKAAAALKTKSGGKGKKSKPKSAPQPGDLDYQPVVVEGGQG